MATSYTKDRRPVTPAPKDKNLHLLTQLLRNMMGVVSAQTNSLAASGEIAAQLGLMLNAEQVLVCAWVPQADRLAVWGEFKQGTKQSLPAPSQKGCPVTTFFARMLNTREPQQSNTTEVGTELKALWKLPRSDKSVLFIPIRLSSGPLGLAIAVGSGKQPGFGPAEMIVSQIFANHAAVLLRNLQLQDNAHRRGEEIEGLRKASLELSSTLDVGEVITVAMRNVHRLLPNVSLARVYTCDGADTKVAGALAAPGLDANEFVDPRPEGWIADVACNGESLYLGKNNDDEARSKFPRDLAIISMSLQSGERVLGVIEIVYGPPVFLDEELRIARLLADQTASAMENSRLHAQAQQAAFTDMLTGLPNRRAFEARLGEELRRGSRYQRSFSVVMVDLDHFKTINDRFGHNVGDVALQDVAHCLRYKVRDTDILARYGGDEFVLILPETQAADAHKLCQKLRSSMNECTIGWSNPDQSMLTFSYGIAEFPRDGQDAASLINLADKAMYGDKSHIPSR